MIFVKPAVRKSLLAKMLGEILDTRVMVKQAMKGARGDKVRLGHDVDGCMLITSPFSHCSMPDSLALSSWRCVVGN
jgi:hypothetical protein